MHVQLEAREALALMGHQDPVRGKGIRVLSIDGGGVRYVAFCTMRIESISEKVYVDFLV